MKIWGTQTDYVVTTDALQAMPLCIHDRVQGLETALALSFMWRARALPSPRNIPSVLTACLQMQVHDVFTGELDMHADADLCRQDILPTSIILLEITEAFPSQLAKAPLTRA